MVHVSRETWHAVLNDLNGNPGRVPIPSRALARAGKARLRLRVHGNPGRVPIPSRALARAGKARLRLRVHGNPGRVRFALRPPTRHHLPARFPLRGLRELPPSPPHPLATLAPSRSASPTPPALWLQAARPWAKPAFAYAIYGSMLSGGPEGRGDSPDGAAAWARPTWWNVRGKSTCTPFPSNPGNLMPWTTFLTQRSESGGAPLTRTRLARPAGSASNDTDTMGF
jgi:hypothetical protein